MAYVNISTDISEASTEQDEHHVPAGILSPAHTTRIAHIQDIL